MNKRHSIYPVSRFSEYILYAFIWSSARLRSVMSLEITMTPMGAPFSSRNATLAVQWKCIIFPAFTYHLRVLFMNLRILKCHKRKARIWFTGLFSMIVYIITFSALSELYPSISNQAQVQQPFLLHHLRWLHDLPLHNQDR